MPDDRLQLPEELEKAIEYLKQAPAPTDYELGKSRARMWEHVTKRGRRYGQLERWWKPAVGVLTTAVVVLLAVFVPKYLHESKVSEIGNASAPHSSPKTYTQSYYEEQQQRMNLYRQQGKRYITTDSVMNADLVEVTNPKTNFKTLEVVKDGEPHQVFSFSNSQSAEATILSDYLIGFQLMNASGGNKVDDGNLYLINTELALKSSSSTHAVKTLKNWAHPSIEILRGMKRDNKVSLLYNTIINDAHTNNEEVLHKWDWDSEKTETVYRSSNNQFLEGMELFPNSIVLAYPKQAVIVTDQGANVIDQADQGVKIMQTSTDGTELVYSKGAVTDIPYGSYRGDVQIKYYDATKGASEPLLPGVTGDQLLVGAPPDNEYLIENFVADDPEQAKMTTVNHIPGTLQFWYARHGAKPKLVYSQKRTSEEFFISVSAATAYISYPVPDPMNGVLLLTPMYSKESDAGFSFNWQTKQLEAIKVDPKQAKQNTSGGK